MRKLASVRKITKIEPIENADAIEIAVVDGWRVVTKKGEYQPGDLCIYCEIDSFLPIKPEFEFLRKSSYKKMGDIEGFRLKTIKLRNQLSQGLLLPMDILPFPYDISDIGTDVSEILGIVKYEPPIPAELAGKVKGLFPSFLQKTDEERIQNLADSYNEFKESGKKFYVTEKLDGSSATFFINDGVFGVCSRNLELLETEGNTFWKVAREMELETHLKSIGGNVCIQGELIGEGIQGNPYKIKGQTVRFFNAYNIDTKEYSDFESFVYLMDYLKLDTVPILDFNYTLPDSIDDILMYAEDKSKLNPNFNREGVVIRSYDRTISFKAISNKFLLKEK